jgi:hypothetical protein
MYISSITAQKRGGNLNWSYGGCSSQQRLAKWSKLAIWWLQQPTKAGKTFAPSTHSTKSNIACMHICSDDNVLNQKLKINIIKLCFLICSSFF